MNFLSSPSTCVLGTPADCKWVYGSHGTSPIILFSRFLDAACTIFHSNLSNIFFTVVELRDGIWYVLSYVFIGTFGLHGLVFYGTTTDPSIPANNEVTCTTSAEPWDNPIINCLFTDRNFFGLSTGGTATIALQDHCGACCRGSGCVSATPSFCADIGGTYKGDDVPCLPNPCP